jgi:hypothetical protein
MAEEFRQELIKHSKTQFMDTLLTDNICMWGETCNNRNTDAKLGSDTQFKRDLKPYVEAVYGVSVDIVWTECSMMLRNALLQRGILHMPDTVLTLTTAHQGRAPVFGVHLMTDVADTTISTAAIETFRAGIMRGVVSEQISFDRVAAEKRKKAARKTVVALAMDEATEAMPRLTEAPDELL